MSGRARRGWTGWVLLALLAFLVVMSACALSCPHDRTHRRFLRRNNEPLRFNLLCDDCAAVVVSGTYVRPWLGPPGGFSGTDEVLETGPWPGPEDDDERR